jgi:transcription termination factor Rho
MANPEENPNDETKSYTFSPQDSSPDDDQEQHTPDKDGHDDFASSAETPLFSSLIPNLGTGLVTLSKPGTTAAAVTLPPPRRSPTKAEKKRIPDTPKKAREQGNSNGNGAQAPAAQPRKQKPSPKPQGQKGRFVRDDAAIPGELLADFPEDEVIQPAYVDKEPEKAAERPRLCRPHLLGTDTEILVTLAEQLGITLKDYPTAGDLVDRIIEVNALRDCSAEQTTYGEGVLEISRDGYGHLRAAELNYQESPEDIYLTPIYVKRYGLRVGDCVLGAIRRPRENDPRCAMVQILAVNGVPLSQRHGLHSFETLTPFYPTQRLLMERGKDELSMRVTDLVTPIGRGQRGLIVAQPRTGKTIILQKLANSILENNDDITLIVLLIDERPEEVTDMKRLVDAEVVASTFDEPPEHHAALCDLVSERAKRLVENGKHVVILLDSITRLARAYNTLAPKSGRILSGGLDANALHKPKRFFGSARNIEGGGSLTILATALIDTGSRMDELIFEEFKGTGNMELHLDRQMADRRVFPAIDITKSGTRREELLVDPAELEIMWQLRKGLCSIGDPANAMERLILNLRKYNTNTEFLLTIRQRSARNQGE